MKMKTTALTVAAALALGVYGAASAATITNSAGTFGFSGFDWSQAGQGLITGYNLLNSSPTFSTDAFTLKFQANATALINGGGTNFNPAGLNSAYEYTIFATVNEIGQCFSLGGVNPCDTVSFNVTGGSYKVFYDTTVNANYSTGTGFTDGNLLIAGSIMSASPVFVPQGPSNPGNASVSPTIFGNVTFQDLAFIVPSFDSTRASTTLQFGSTIGLTWVAPTFFDGIAVGTIDNTNFFAQADANQTFAVVPEPTTLALLGIGLLGVGFGTRRRTHAA